MRNIQRRRLFINKNKARTMRYHKGRTTDHHKIIILIRKYKINQRNHLLWWGKNKNKIKKRLNTSLLKVSLSKANKSKREILINNKKKRRNKGIRRLTKRIP